MCIFTHNKIILMQSAHAPTSAQRVNIWLIIALMSGRQIMLVLEAHPSCSDYHWQASAGCFWVFRSNSPEKNFLEECRQRLSGGLCLYLSQTNIISQHYVQDLRKKKVGKLFQVLSMLTFRDLKVFLSCLLLILITVIQKCKQQEYKYAFWGKFGFASGIITLQIVLIASE